MKKEYKKDGLCTLLELKSTGTFTVNEVSDCFSFQEAENYKRSIPLSPLSVSLLYR